MKIKSLGSSMVKQQRFCSFQRIILSPLLLVFLSTTPAFANWEDYYDLDGPSRIVNTDQCDARLKLTYNSWLLGKSRPTTQYFTLSNTRTHAVGSTYQSLRFNVTHREAFVFNSFGLMSNDDFRTFRSDIEPDAGSSNEFRRDLLDFQLHIDMKEGSPAITKFEYSRDHALRNFTLQPQGDDPSQDSRLTLQVNCPTPKEIANVAAEANSVYSQSYGPEKAIDANTSTYWISSSNPTTPITFTLMFDRAYDLVNLKLNWYSAQYTASNFDVQISEDGSTYTTVVSGLEDEKNIDLTGFNGKSVRLLIHNIRSNFVVLREVSVLGR